MLGKMQNEPLLVNSILDHAQRYHRETEIVSILTEGNQHRETYAEAHLRTRKISQALLKIGLKKGDVIATMAWNTHRHFEAWYAITGIGAIYHTLNPRLFAQQLTYIINHAEDKFIFIDLTFIPLLEAIQDHLKNVQGYVILTDQAHMPETKLQNIYCFETLIEAENGDFDWVIVEENDACGICYTSGTTGCPRGVVYSHRSNVLHTLTTISPDVLQMSQHTTIMPVVPMFHANAWGIIFAAPMVGAKIVNPGPHLDGKSIYTLLDSEKVNLTAAVPTLWMMLLQYVEDNNLSLPYLDSVVIGGSAAPRIMIEKFERDYGVEVNHAWGMTEMSPFGTVGKLKPHMEEWDFTKRIDLKEKQGRAPYMVSMKITDDQGKELPWDGKTFGHLKVKGPFISSAYLKEEDENILDAEGYFDTGDIATIDQDGFMQITDRTKDVIKSGGEWISSIEIENLAVGHPSIAEAAVIGIAHPKWDERPLLIVIRKKDTDISKEEILTYLKDKIAKWWIPDDVIFVNEIPHTATGKIHKITLREQFKDYKLPTA